MPAPRKYPNELRERAQRLVSEAMSEDPSLSMNAAVRRIAQDHVRAGLRRVVTTKRRPIQRK